MRLFHLSDLHLGKRVYAFSMLVTLFQYLVLTFLPELFFRFTDWCTIPCQLIHLSLGPVDTYVFNYPVTGDATGGMGYFAAFAMAPSHTVNLATDGYGRLLGQIYGNSVDDVAMRKAIQDVPDVDVPNPYPAESEGGES